MFTIALFTIAKTWKQLKCPSKDEWIKNEIITFGATWMDLEISILSEAGQRKRQIDGITYVGLKI